MTLEEEERPRFVTGDTGGNGLSTRVKYVYGTIPQDDERQSG